MGRTSRTFAAVVAGALLLAACGEADDNGAAAPDPDVDDRGTFRVGLANEVPYGFIGDDGEPAGQAPAVAREVLSRMGYSDIDAEVVDFGALINGLNADQYDMIAAGMFINEDRASQALFTDPDYCGTTAFAVPDGNPDGLTDFESVTDAGITLGVLSGAVEDDYATGSGVPDDQLERFPETADMVDALESGIIDAFALTAVTVVEQTDPIDGFESSEGFVPVIDGEEELGCGGFVFSFDNDDLRNEFNDILVEMRDNNELLPLVEEYGFTEAELEPAQGMTVEDLVGQPYDFAMNGG